MKYSFLIPYYDRAKEFRLTLESMSYHYQNRDDFELIVGEDIKTGNNKIEHDKLIELCEEFKDKLNITLLFTSFENCYNPAPIFNACAVRAEGEYFILTSPEILHKNNILKGFDEELLKDKNAYVVPSCECVQGASFADGKTIYTHFKWYSHSKHRRSLLHWCNVIRKEKYWEIGGFDNEFAKGIACEDDDFLERVRADKEITIVQRDDLETLHIQHNKPRLNMKEYKALHKINSDYSDRKRKERTMRMEGLVVRDRNKAVNNIKKIRNIEKEKELQKQKERAKQKPITKKKIGKEINKPTFVGRLARIGDSLVSLNRTKENEKVEWFIVYIEKEQEKQTVSFDIPLKAVEWVLNKLKIDYD
jgi:hypothetical protein